LPKAYVLQEQGSLLELVDPSLGSNYTETEVMNMLNIALLCTNPSPTLRPSMSSVASMLEGKSRIQAPLIKRQSVNENLTFKSFEKLLQDSQPEISTFSEDSQAARSMSMDAPWSTSSSSFPSKDGPGDHSSSSKLRLPPNDGNV